MNQVHDITYKEHSLMATEVSDHGKHAATLIGVSVPFVQILAVSYRGPLSRRLERKVASSLSSRRFDG